ELPRLFVQANCILEASHLAVKRAQRRLAIMRETGIQLQRTLSSCRSLVEKTEISIEFTGEIAHPERSRIDPVGATQIPQRLVALAARGIERGDEIIRWRRVGIDLHGANEFCFCAIKVPIEDAFCFSQIHVSLGFLIVDLEGAHSGVADPAIRFPWRYI